MEQSLINLAQERGELRQQIDELTIEIRGYFEGHEGRPGIVTRVDRLEQIELRRAKVVWMTFAASITALATALWEKIVGH